jgi:hypothetical protein
VGDPGSWNRYAYVEGDPVNRIDPEGLVQVCLKGDGCKSPPPPPPPIPPFCQINPQICNLPPQQQPQPGFMCANGRVVHAIRECLGFMSDVREDLIEMVKAGRMTDCQALAGFAAIAGIYADGDAGAFVSAFGNLFYDSAIPQTLHHWGVHGLAGGAGGSELNFQGPRSDGKFPASGFQPAYRDGNNEDADQGHHFAFYFMVGFRIGQPFGSLGALAFDLNNPGDVILGNRAASIGNALRNNPGRDCIASAIAGISGLCN